MFWEVVLEAVRQVRRRPLFVAGIALTLVLGIGANAVMFGVVDRLLLRPPMHVDDPERVRLLYRHVRFQDRPVASSGFTYPDYEKLKEVSAFESAAAVWEYPMTLGHGVEARQIKTGMVSGSFFATLGVQPYRGRFFGSEDDGADAEPAAVLGYDFWQGHFAGEEVLGREIEVGNLHYTIVGIAPPGFTGVNLSPNDIWVPFVPAAMAGSYARWLDSPNSWWISIVARLKEGIALQAANEEATAVARHVDEEVRKRKRDYEVRVTAESLIAAQRPRTSATDMVAVALAGVAFIVLLIACANVANLLLVRTVRREREVAVRLALGLSRERLVTQLLADSVLIALIGGGAALLAAHWGSRLVTALLPMVDWTQGILTPRLLAFALGLSVFCGLLAGLAPALQAFRSDLAEPLKSGSQTVAGGRSRVRTALLVAQTVLSVVLLVAAGLFVNSLLEVESLDLGYHLDNLYWMNPELESELEYHEQVRLYQSAVERLERLPGVIGAAAASSTPFRSSSAVSLEVPGRERLPHSEDGGPYIVGVIGDYFKAVGIDIVRGRPLMDADRKDSEKVAVVGRTMASMVWPDEDPLGKCLLIWAGSEEKPGCTTVVGVADDARRSSLVEKDTMQYYVPIEQFPSEERFMRPKALFVHTADSGPAPEQLRRELHAFDQRFRFLDPSPMMELTDRHKRAWRMGAALFSAFGLLALAVAAVGLYSVISFEVAQRRHEMGIRAALGATARNLVSLVMGRSVRLAALGVAIGLLLAALAAAQIESLLFQTSPFHPASYLGVAAVLLLSAAAASALPSWRASQVDPNKTLKTE